MSSIANMTSELRLMLGVHAQSTSLPRAMYDAMVDVLTGQCGVRKAAERHKLSRSTLADSIARFRRAAAGACELAGVRHADLVHDAGAECEHEEPNKQPVEPAASACACAHDSS